MLTEAATSLPLFLYSVEVHVLSDNDKSWDKDDDDDLVELMDHPVASQNDSIEIVSHVNHDEHDDVVEFVNLEDDDTKEEFHD
eukprot:14492572-Ditylum_brightwellii.AAC.1